MHAEPNPGPGPWANANALRTAAHAVIIVAGSWWLLGQLAAVLRPLLLAVFLGYVLLPYYARLRLRMPAPVALGLLGGVTTGVLVLTAFAVLVSLGGLADEEPRLRARAVEFAHKGSELVNEYLPGAVGGSGEARPPEEVAAERFTAAAVWLANLAAFGLIEAATAGLYLLFLLTEAAKFPDRVRAAYPEDRAAEVLHVFGRINAAVISYLKAKVLSSLVLAVPVGVILGASGVRFALLWAVLTFVCNFIPYIGSVVSYTLPVGFAFLQFDDPSRPLVVAILVLAWTGFTAAVTEPLIIGKAVGLSPIVVLAALSVWGALWGLPGMFLAVPLTVVVVLVLGNIEATRPVARLLGG